jgi:hypothetical protein
VAAAPSAGEKSDGEAEEGEALDYATVFAHYINETTQFEVALRQASAAVSISESVHID